MTSTTGPKLNDCGCCEGLTAQTPAEVVNRPGLAAVAYRVGTHAQFKTSMLARLSSSGLPALQGLNTRDDDDFSIALLDAWATVADVLTFYQERIANEAFLRTATERLSVLQLVRQIGYELRPGVAADALLAFTLETATGSPTEVTLDSGTRTQSVPGPGELPQTFETVEELTARPEGNALKPRLTRPRPLVFGDQEVYLTGVTTDLKTGDALLIVGSERVGDATSERWDFRRIETVTPDTDAGRTKVTWAKPLGWRRHGRTILPAERNQAVYALRQRAALFGYNAPNWLAMPDTVKTAYGGAAGDTQWPDFTISGIAGGAANTAYLDAIYAKVQADGWLVLVIPNTPPNPHSEELYQVTAAQEDARANFTLSAKTTRVELEGENLSIFDNKVRETVVFAQSETLEVAETPITDAIPDNPARDRITLGQKIDWLEKGRLLIVSGSDAVTGEAKSEAITLLRPETEDDLTRLVFTTGLVNTYRRDSVTIYANVAPATHGETVNEVLGGGDASVPFQKFALKNTPLTYVRADNPQGAETTLKIYVDNLLWREVPTLYGLGPRDRAYITRIEDSGATTVQFGDGKTGARPPTGQENVRATYRKGIGVAGNVKAGQISLLLTRPLGVQGVNNPLPASGAQDADSRDDARTLAPKTVLTLDRVVSLRDFEDFAAGFAGIGKALATWVWDGERRGVLLTVAGPDGAVIEETSDLHNSLFGALQAAGDARVPLYVKTHRPAPFRVRAAIQAESDYIPERVLAAAEQALRDWFAFDLRAFGQPVALSEVMAVLQGTPGVTFADVNELYREDARPRRHPEPILFAETPHAGEAASALGAELLVLDLLTGDIGVRV